MKRGKADGPNPLERLLRTTHGEDNRKSNIRSWLESEGFDIEGEWQVGCGRVDLYLTNRRVLIETKIPKYLDGGPNALGTGASGKESVFQQLERYVMAERNRERLYETDDETRWLGAVTDKRRWWIWEWPPHGKGDEPRPVRPWQGRMLDQTGAGELRSLFDREVGKPWAPRDATSILSPHLEGLRDLHVRNGGFDSTKTMRALWLRQLRLSGNAPQPGDEYDLFILHTFLIAVSAAISHSVSRSEPDLGFAAWINLDDTEWYDTLQDTVDTYDWRQRSGDLLRSLYMGMVDARHRKMYGEFYTPDWLAELVCHTILDDEWITQRIADHYRGAYSAVLDPACGSGTFLYHAARRIMLSEPVRRANMDADDLNAMMTRLLHGIDIHPVAVAMSKTNLLRAMPHAHLAALRVWSGDSLQTDRPDAGSTMLFESDGALTVYSRRERPIQLPVPFLDLPDHVQRIRRLVSSANRDTPFPPGLDAGLAAADAGMLRDTYEELADICRNEGNDIWAWYVLNRVGPYQLMRSKVSRIVANPPWVRLSNIQERARRREMERAAEQQKLWVGRENATGFDISQLFVDKCLELYMAEDGRSGWVLPQAALRGSNWAGYAEKHKPTSWDLGNLPFPAQSNACVHLFGTGGADQALVRTGGAPPPRPGDDWNTVSQNVRWAGVEDGPAVERSAWYAGARAMARQGATLVPNCLVVVDRHTVRDGEARFTTAHARHQPWRDLGTRTGVVPEHWIRDAVFGRNLLPYRLTDRLTSVVMPLDDTGTAFYTARGNEYWNKAEQLYQSHRSRGKTTPGTLLDRLDKNKALSEQLGKREGHLVAYNSSGARLCAARAEWPLLVEHTLYYIAVRSGDEASFLTAILNADALQGAFEHSKHSARHFMAHFWRKIPIPRYDHGNELHQQLSKMCARAETLADGVDMPDSPTHRDRERVRNALRDDGVSGEIDRAVRQLLPRHT